MAILTKDKLSTQPRVYYVAETQRLSGKSRSVWIDEPNKDDYDDVIPTVEKTAYDNVLIERDDLLKLIDTLNKYVDPGTCDSGDSALKVFQELKAELEQAQDEVDLLRGAKEALTAQRQAAAVLLEELESHMRRAWTSKSLKEWVKTSIETYKKGAGSL